MRHSSIAVLIGFSMIMGCGGSSSSGGTGGSGSTATGAGGGSSSTGSTGSGGSGGGVVCNTLTNIGTTVSETADPGPVPMMMGGPIADGTYVLTAAVEYAGSGASSKTHKRTLAIKGNIVQLVNSDDGGPDIHATITVAPSGVEFNETATCPAGLMAKPSSYTATATSLLMRKDGENQVETYTKQ